MFANPLFLLAALAGACIPLLLHMLRKRRTIPQPFPTLRFLKLAEKMSSRRMRLEHLLLWLLRTAIMLLIGLAFAMPTLRARGLRFLARTPRDVAIVLDASYSMQYRVGRQSVWDKAVETAAGLIEGLGASDRFSLYLARAEPMAIVAEPIGDHEHGLALLSNLEAGPHTSRLAPALAAANAGLHRDGARREREIHVLTDNQALPWEAFTNPADAPRAMRWDSEQADARTTLFVSLLGVDNPVNTYISDIEIDPTPIPAGTDARINVMLGHSGPPRETTVDLWINDAEVGRRSSILGGSRREPVSFVLPPLPAGTHAARVATPDDNLSFDNAFHFLIRVGKQPPVLLVGDARDTVFLRMALQAGGVEDAVSIPPGQLDGHALGRYACIFLCNVLPLDGQLVTTLERYAQSGGLLVVFPGTRATPDDYRAWRALPGVPAEIRDLPRSERSRALLWEQPTHPLLQDIADTTTSPRLTIQHMLSWEDEHPESTRLVSAGVDAPFLLKRPFGEGRVLIFAVSADRSWSSFPITTQYLPTIMSIVEYGAGVGTQAPYAWSTDYLALEALPYDGSPDAELLDPVGNAVPIQRTIEDGRTVRRATVTEPGIYRKRISADTDPLPALAVNVPRGESDLTPLDSATLSDLLGMENVHVAHDRESLDRLIREHRIGRTYAEPLLWVALILVGIEFAYANALSRSSSKTEQKPL